MIFMTVGSTFFDAMVSTVDKLAGDGIIQDKVIAQIGSGRYVPKHAEFFRYAPSLEQYYSQANIIISHAAAGTLFTALGMGKKIIAVSNPRLGLYMDTDAVNAYSSTKGREIGISNRQQGLPMRLEDEGYLVWCEKVSDIMDALEGVKGAKLKEYQSPPCNIGQRIIQSLG